MIRIDSPADLGPMLADLRALHRMRRREFAQAAGISPQRRDPGAARHGLATARAQAEGGPAVSLADQIIEHGPWRDGGRIMGTVDMADLNELRDELIAARKTRERQERFHVEGDGSEVDSVVVIRCAHCKWTHEHVIQGRETTWRTLDLAELNRRADEHGDCQ